MGRQCLSLSEGDPSSERSGEDFYLVQFLFQRLKKQDCLYLSQLPALKSNNRNKCDFKSLVLDPLQEIS